MGRRREAGSLESAVLSALWAADEPLTPAQVLETLPGQLAYTTVMTVLSRLYTKGLAHRVPAGRGYAYRPADGPVDYAARQMHRVLAQETDAGAVLARFVNELESSEEQALRELLADRSRRDEDQP